MKNYLKLSLSVILTLTLGFANAQQTTGDYARETVINPGQSVGANDDGSVKVIDNKGNIRYLQVKNGLTTLANTTNDITTITWQLGGTLSDTTLLSVDTAANAMLGINGIELIGSNFPASTDATNESTADGSNSGYTFLVRDEATGAIKKRTAADLVTSGQQNFTVTTTGQDTFALTGNVLPGAAQVWVYRNGAKLSAFLDYNVVGDEVILDFGASNTWNTYVGDAIEVQFIK